MTVRQARISDAGDISTILNEVIRNTLVTFTTIEGGEAKIAAEIALRWRAFQVIEEEGKVVGFATFGRFRDGPGYAHTKELTIHLAAGARGQGLGRSLLNRLEEVAVAQGVHVLVAGVSGANPEGIAFHTACGYQEVGRLKEVGFKAGEMQDLILMQKFLPAVQAVADSNGADS